MSLPDYTASIERMKAERARRAAMGDPFAIRAQAAQERAEAEQREEDRRERDRLRKLLDLDDNSKPTLNAAVVSRDPNAPLAPREAASYLAITIEQLTAHVKDGALRYINVGRGKKRPRYSFAIADLEAFKTARTTLEQPCPSSSPRSPNRTTGTLSRSNVVGFSALRAARLAKKPSGSRP